MTDLTHHAHDAASPNLNATVTGGDRRTLDGVFRHPLAHNLSWRDVVGLFAAIGEVDEKSNGEFLFSLGRETLSVNKPHNKDMTAPEVMELRHFLMRAGWSPDAAPPAKGDALPSMPSLIVIIDHAGAKIYHVDRSADDHHAFAAADPRHLLHHLEHKQRDADRDETYPDDERYFERIADAVAAGGDIVVIGHGKGHGNEADQLSAYLRSHHKETYARIVREIVADLPHLTTPELPEIGVHAFPQA